MKKYLSTFMLVIFFITAGLAAGLVFGVSYKI